MAWPPTWSAPPHAHEQELEWTLSSFEGDGAALLLVPLYYDEPWESIPALAARRPDALVCGLFTPMSQLERSFSAALRRAHRPIVCLPPERASVLTTIMRELLLGLVISLWRDQVSIPASTDLLHVRVLAPADRPERYDQPGVGFEMHLVPGLSILRQCETTFGSNAFHPSDNFAWTFEGAAAALTDRKAPPRFARLPLPGALRATEEPCACGAATRIELL